MISSSRIDYTQSWVLSGFAASLPLGSKVENIALIISLLLVILKVGINRGANQQKDFLNRHYHIFPCLFLIACISLIYTFNIHEGLFRIQQKLVFLILPVVFLTIDKINLKLILRIYILSTVCALGYCYFVAFKEYFSSGRHFFFYTYFSQLLHPSYFALHLNLSVSLVIISLFQKKGSRLLHPFLGLMCVGIMCVGVYNVDSKSGILTLFLVFSVVLGISFYKRIGFMASLIFGVCFILIFLFALKWKGEVLISDRFTQVQTALDAGLSNATESNGGRLQAMHTALLCCKDNLMLGVGIGDVNEVLRSGFTKLGYNYAFRNKLNCHNQFLQTWLGSGVLALVLLLYLLLKPILLQRKNINLFVLCIILLFNFMFESMLERQYGLFFFCFFYLLFSEENISSTSVSPSGTPVDDQRKQTAYQ